MSRVMPRTVLRWGLTAALLAVACQSGPERRVEGRFGSVAIHTPQGDRRGCVFVFSGEGGPNDALDRAARSIASAGSAVVEVDLPQYLRNLAASDDGCHYVVSELEDLSRRLERELAFPAYRAPILAGEGAGGTLAYAALAQAPAATIAGAVSVDPAPSLATRVPLCPGAPSEPAPGGGFRYGPFTPLPGWWTVAPPDSVPESLRVLATPAALAATAPTRSAPERLAELVRAALPSSDAAAGESAQLAELPLVELPSASPGADMAVIYSGDGGWRDIDKQIGEALAAQGVPVVGVDSLRYFWRRRTPDEVARDLTRILDHYGTLWNRPRVALVGYSFGAGILPFAYNRLPPADRERVALLTLLGVEHRAPFEFSITGWLSGSVGEDALPVMPEIDRLPHGLLQCVYGADEKDTICREPGLAAIGAEVIRTSGGHHFDGDYRSLAARILTALERRRSAASAAPRPRDHLPTTPRMPPETSVATFASTRASAMPP